MREMFVKLSGCSYNIIAESGGAIAIGPAYGIESAMKASVEMSSAYQHPRLTSTMVYGIIRSLSVLYITLVHKAFNIIFIFSPNSKVLFTAEVSYH
jgi:hypothetical protein